MTSASPALSPGGPPPYPGAFDRHDRVFPIILISTAKSSSRSLGISATPFFHRRYGVRPGLGADGAAPSALPIAWAMCSRADPTGPRCTSSIGVPGRRDDVLGREALEHGEVQFALDARLEVHVGHEADEVELKPGVADLFEQDAGRGFFEHVGVGAGARPRSISAARTGSAVRGTLTGAMTRPVRSLRTRFLTTPEIRFEFGTITVERSKVSISVARTLMRRT